MKKLDVPFTGTGNFYGACKHAGVVSVGGWVAAKSTEWTTVATGLPKPALATFTVVPCDNTSSQKANSMKARVTVNGELDIRLLESDTSYRYGDFNIAYIAQ